MKRWRTDPTEENFWGVVLAYAGVKFKTYSGLLFSYEIKKAGTASTRNSCGSTAGRRVKVWRGVLLFWLWEILKGK